MPATSSQHNQPEFSVSEIAAALKRVVEDTFGYVRVRGEISGFKQAASGHVYFDLKDEKAVLNSVCWKGVAARLSFKPENGLEVVCSGKVSTYPGRSNYQLVVEQMEPAGIGALMALLEQRKKALEAEGLFDAARKKPRPYLPDVIGIVTSPTGAVIRDILHRLSERFPVRVLVWPVIVQGEGAAAQVAHAIEGFNQFPKDGLPRPDLLIVARGGGSIEDLWAFNEEVVVRAAAASSIPLISAVGHETDTTLIDFASDLRAPTPTAAAELAVPVRDELLAWVMDAGSRLYKAILKDLRSFYERVQGLAGALPKPAYLLGLQQQRMDELSGRIETSLVTFLDRKSRQLEVSVARLTPGALSQALKTGQAHLNQLMERAGRSILHLLQRREEIIHALSRMLSTLDYHNVLRRGFALVKDGNDRLVGSRKAVPASGSLSIQFHDGEQVVEIPSKKTPGKKTKSPSMQDSLF